MMKIQRALIDDTGNNLLNDFYDEIMVCQKTIIVRRNLKFGAYDKETFKELFECVWDCIKEYKQGLKVTKGKNNGFYSFITDDLLDGCNWDKISIRENGIIVYKNGLQGFRSYEGEKIFECIYKRVETHPKAIVAFGDNKRTVYQLIG